MIRTILSNALRLAADALDTHPAPWEAELDVLRQQIGDIDAAVADGFGERTRSIDALAGRLIEAMGASSLQDAVEIAEGYKADAADADKEVDRLNAKNAELRRDTYSPRPADRDKMRHALFIAGVHGGPGAWRWHSDPLGTTHGDVGAFCRLMLERLDARAPEATDSANLTARLDAARDGLKTAQSCLDREGETLVVGALGAIKRGLARSAPSLSDIDKAAELRAADWRHYEGRGWALGAYGLGYLDTDDAYRAMVEDREREKARATPPNPFTAERFMQLALLNAEWKCNNLGWHRPNRIGFDVLTTYTTTEAAFECMLADRAKAAPPRDTMTQPEPGDLYVDKDGDAWFCLSPRTYVLATRPRR